MKRERKSGRASAAKQTKSEPRRRVDARHAKQSRPRTAAPLSGLPELAPEGREPAAIHSPADDYDQVFIGDPRVPHPRRNQRCRIVDSLPQLDDRTVTVRFEQGGQLTVVPRQQLRRVEKRQC